MVTMVDGGGVPGAMHVVFRYALEQRGLVPDMVIGTSLGARYGVIAATRPDTAAPCLDHTWTPSHQREVYPLGYVVSRAGVLTGRGPRRLIARAGLPSRIEQLSVSFTAVTMDPVTGEPALIGLGDLESVPPAGSAIPKMLRPMNREGRVLVDGGVVACVPVLADPQTGPADVMVVATGPENSPSRPTTPRRPAGAIVARVRRLSLHHQIGRDLREVSEHIPIVVLPSGFEAWPAPRDFRRSQRLINSAARTAGRFLDGMRVSGPYLHGVDNASTAAARPGETSTSFTSGVGL